MLAGLLLGMNELTVDSNLVDAPTRRDKRDLRNGLVVIVKDFLRQTGGFREISSRRAVLDGYFPVVSHENSLFVLLAAH